MNALPKVYRKEIGHAKEYFKEWHRNFRIRLGCMSLGTEYANAEPIIEKAIESGITYFDTADIYDKGTNEEIVGKALKISKS